MKRRIKIIPGFWISVTEGNQMGWRFGKNLNKGRKRLLVFGQQEKGGHWRIWCLRWYIWRSDCAVFHFYFFSNDSGWATNLNESIRDFYSPLMLLSAVVSFLFRSCIQLRFMFSAYRASLWHIKAPLIVVSLFGNGEFEFCIALNTGYKIGFHVWPDPPYPIIWSLCLSRCMLFSRLLAQPGASRRWARQQSKGRLMFLFKDISPHIRFPGSRRNCRSFCNF